MKWKQCIFIMVLVIFSVNTPIAQALSSTDPYVPYQWHLDQIHAEEAWEVTTGSTDVIVAVIDTGVDIYHEELSDAIWQNQGEVMGNRIDDDGNGYIDDIHGWNFIRQSNDVRPQKEGSTEDAYAHGTAVASLIAANGENGKGMAGVAWHVTIMPIVALDEEGMGYTTDIAKAIVYASDHGASIINLSMEGPTDDPQLDEAIAYAKAKGALTITASGNAEDELGLNLDEHPIFPACLEDDEQFGVITVGGTDRGDVKAAYANFGSCVDLSAPSVDILAARPLETGNDGYANGYSGTSLAVPIVSGVAALLKSKYPTWGPDDIRARLLETATPIDLVNAEAVRGGLGVGRVDAGRALGSASIVLSESLMIASTNSGVPTSVHIQSDESVLRILPFGEQDMRGARTAFSDLNADGVPEILVVPATGTVAEYVILNQEGDILTTGVFPGGLTNGAVVVGTSDGFVVADDAGGAAWGIDRQLVIHSFYPYEAHYRNGVDLMRVAGAAAFAPRDGGGRLVIRNAKGEQLVSAFPFGMDPYGRWSLALMTDEAGTYLVFSGPVGTKRLRMDALGQIGWEDVTFEQLERSMLEQTSGQFTNNPTYRQYDRWPQD